MSDWPDHFTRDMSCAPAEWQRLLQRALAGHDWAAQGDAQVRIALAGGALTLQWAPGPARQIALLRLPTLHLHFAFDGVPPAERQAFMRHLDLHTHRGGG
ncbi:hypothetical protein QY917_12865 [Diaphorobacter sp. C33]|uniref:Uncharacterized protein n=1 Tax=Diaphorobacter nitroreducens TaxID=164759 RepID=A0AAX1WXZ5_9BURK|nr:MULTISPECIES: hypothetical protein [Diaphorobacter]ROR49316.1 hypothetical protein EDC60_1311 [Diaphorobacter nitroreducens]WKK88724.1 hypothetical protein QY917_12865 [Diaphorobacter sp. C33]